MAEVKDIPHETVVIVARVRANALAAAARALESAIEAHGEVVLGPEVIDEQYLWLFEASAAPRPMARSIGEPGVKEDEIDRWPVEFDDMNEGHGTGEETW